MTLCPPPLVAMERNMWQQPIDAGAVSQQGKAGAAEQTLKATLAALAVRKCTEEWVADTQVSRRTAPKKVHR